MQAKAPLLLSALCFVTMRFVFLENILDFLFPILAIFVGFVALVWGADRFVVGASATAHLLGVSPLIIGITIVGIGTSAPEILVSLMASFTGNPQIAIGNALGSNITNVGLVLGTAAIVRPLVVHPSLVKKEIPILLGVMVVAFVFLADQALVRWEGVLLLLGMVLMLWRAFSQGRKQSRVNKEAKNSLGEQENPTDSPNVFPVEEVPKTSMKLSKALGWLAFGLLVLLTSSRLLVWGAEVVATLLEIDPFVIGLTVVALGTSLPELTASVVAALKNEHDIAIGNVIGSNIFNLFVVLGLPGVIQPGPIPPQVVLRDFPMAFVLVVLLFAMTLGPRVRGKLTRFNGVVLVLLYLVYIIFLIRDPSFSIPANIITNIL